MSRMRTVRALLVTVAVPLIGLAALTASASATTSSGVDPSNDNGAANNPRGDVTNFSVSYNGSTVAVSTTVRTFDNPATSSNWINEPTAILFGIDTTNDANPEFVVVYFNDGNGNVLAQVAANNAAGDFLCDATPGFNAAARTYTATFPASCISSPGSVELGIIFGYFTPTTQSFDDTSFTAPASGSTTTSSSTTSSSTTSSSTSTSTSSSTSTVSTSTSSTSSTTVPPSSTSTTTSILPSSTTTTTPPSSTSTTAAPRSTTTTAPAATSSTTATIATQGGSSSSTTVAAAAATTSTSAAPARAPLPRTGGSTMPMVFVSLTLVAAGSALSLRRRRTAK